MKTITMTCINCPVGCGLTVTLDETCQVEWVKDNQCARGVAYATMEVTNPTRTMTSTVRVRWGCVAQAPVKTSRPVPKDMVVECVKALAHIELKAPVVLGQIVLPDVYGTGVDIVATRSIPSIS